MPVDAVNTSASNLDPEISQANAWIQAHRIAAKRRLSLSAVDCADRQVHRRSEGSASPVSAV